MSTLSKLSGENYVCFPLDWDTDYFGIKSAKVILDGIVATKDQDRILDYCKAFKFITISNIENLKENNYWIGRKSGAFLSDINIQFTKEVHREPEFKDSFTKIYDAYKRDRKVIEIAKSAFRYSRFFNDPALPQEQAKNIYLHWTECAFEQIGKYFVIAKRNGEVAGYILFSINKEQSFATIELIAVDEKFFGKKVGQSLIYELEAFSYRNSISLIKVGTQADNIAAANFYRACGFRYASCSSIYHLWMDNSNKYEQGSLGLWQGY